jgi:D-alanyl-D-alanine carboxypeptidase/D-alanyl-D-alanine-endopeptidase (penicillin-binding protein 4)
VARLAVRSKNPSGVPDLLRTELSRRGFLAAAGAFAITRPARATAPLPELQGLLDAASRWATTGHARFGACFLDARSGAELACVSADVAENPASNMKLVTAGAALRYLGAGAVFESGLYGRIQDGRVETLVLRGDGDPSLASDDLALFAAELRARGVKQIGDILVDQSAFDERFVPPGFEQQPDEWAAFRAPVSAVAVDRNSVFVTIAPGAPGTPARVGFEPPGFVDVEGEIATVAKGKRAIPRVGPQARGQRLGVRLGGAVAEGSAPIRYRQRVDDPRVFAGYSLRAALAAAGVAVAGSIRQGGASEQRELFVHRSRPLSELLPELGKASDNFYAEMLLRGIGKKVRGRPATSAAGAEAALAWLKEIGAADTGSRITNGSGLFDANRLTPRSLARLLVATSADPAHAPAFHAHLAIGGVDGTLKSRFPTLSRHRSVVAKTGTLKDVVALSGYVLDPDGKPSVAFSIIMSSVKKTAAARERVDRIVELVAGWVGGRV